MRRPRAPRPQPRRRVDARPRGAPPGAPAAAAPRDPRGDDRAGAGHRFEDRHRAGLDVRGEGKNVAGRKDFRHIAATAEKLDGIGQIELRRERFQLRSLRPVASPDATSAFLRVNALGDRSLINQLRTQWSPRALAIATRRTQRPTGTSQPITPEPNAHDYSHTSRGTPD